MDTMSCMFAVDTIKFAAGRYVNLGDNRDQSFTCWDNLVVIGGFESGGLAFDPSTNIAELHGELGSPSDDSDNRYHIVHIDENIKGVQLHNLKLSGAYADGIGMHSFGAGILCKGELSLSNVHISNNYSDDEGSGFYITSTGSLSVKGESLIENNVSSTSIIISGEIGGKLNLEPTVLIQN